MAVAKPGVALKALRDRNRWTLAEVNKRTGIPASTLSRIENDQVSPTYDMLMKLGRGLDIDLSELLSIGDEHRPPVAEQAGRRSINHIGDGQTIELTHHTLNYLSNDLLQKHITPILCEYRAKSLQEFGALMRHPGEEFLYVVEGELELHTECYAPTILKAGESVYFDSRMGHAYIAKVQPCRALSVCTVPLEPEEAEARG